MRKKIIKMDRKIILAKVLKKLAVELSLSSLHKLITLIRKLSTRDEIYKVLKHIFNSYNMSKKDVESIVDRLKRKEQLPSISPAHFQAFRKIMEDYGLRF